MASANHPSTLLLHTVDVAVVAVGLNSPSLQSLQCDGTRTADVVSPARHRVIQIPRSEAINNHGPGCSSPSNGPCKALDKSTVGTARSGGWRSSLAAHWSVVHSWRVLTDERASGSQNPLRCLDGLRVLSMGWIILGHTLFYGVNLGFSNFAELLPPHGRITEWAFQARTRSP